MKIIKYKYDETKEELKIHFDNIVGLNSFKITTVEGFKNYKNLIDPNSLNKSLKTYNQRTLFVEEIFRMICGNVQILWQDDQHVILKGSLTNNNIEMLISELESININTVIDIEPSLVENNSQAILELRDRFIKYEYYFNKFPISCQLDKRKDISAFKILSMMFEYENEKNIIDYENIFNDTKYNVLPFIIPLTRVTNINDDSIKNLVYHGIICHPIRDCLVLTYQKGNKS